MFRFKIHNIKDGERYEFTAPTESEGNAIIAEKSNVYGAPAEREVVIEDMAADEAENAARQVIDAVQRMLDEQAQAWGYDDIRAACTYADEPAVPRFQEEGKALRAWRSLTWEACYAVSGTAKTMQDVLVALPPPPVRPTPT